MQGFQKLELQNMSGIIVIQSEQVFDNFETLCFKSQKMPHASMSKNVIGKE